jgi:hypothetical protein
MEIESQIAKALISSASPYDAARCKMTTLLISSSHTLTAQVIFVIHLRSLLYLACSLIAAKYNAILF